MDKFRYFPSLAADPLTVEIPEQVTKPSDVTRALHKQLGLSFPHDTETLWHNSRRCTLKRKHDGTPLGELIEVIE